MVKSKTSLGSRLTEHVAHTRIPVLEYRIPVLVPARSTRKQGGNFLWASRYALILYPARVYFFNPYLRVFMVETSVLWRVPGGFRQSEIQGGAKEKISYHGKTEGYLYNIIPGKNIPSMIVPVTPHLEFFDW